MLHGYFGYKLATILYTDGSYYAGGMIKQRNPFKICDTESQKKTNKVTGRNAIFHC